MLHITPPPAPPTKKKKTDLICRRKIYAKLKSMFNTVEVKETIGGGGYVF